MAIIRCYECNAEMSDRAAACPRCGAPRQAAAAPPPPPVSQPAPAPSTHIVTGPEVGLHAQKFVCPGCGARLESKDILSSGWAHCSVCDKDVHLGGVNSAFSDEGLVEKIYPAADNKEHFHKNCMQRLMDVGPRDLFTNLTNVKTTRRYVWVREFGRGANRQILPMSNYGNNCFTRLFGAPVVNCDVYDSIWPARNMKEFDTSQLKGSEFVSERMSAKECKHQYSVSPGSKGFAETDTYYCLPVLEETFDYDGQHYLINAVQSQVDKEYKWSSDQLPAATSIIGQKPRKFTFMPVTYSLAALIAIAIITGVISMFVSMGFWTTVIYLVIIGIILSFVGIFVGGLLMAVPVGIDTVIAASVNASRRKKFRDRYEEMQKHKQEEARRLHGLELSYVVPSFKED